MKDNIYTLSVDDDQNSILKYEFKSNTDVVICVDKLELSENSICKIEKACQNLIEKVNRFSAEGRNFLDEIRKTGLHLTDLLFSKNLKEELRLCNEKYLKIEISEFMMKIPWELLCIDNQFLGEKFRIGRFIRKHGKVLKFEDRSKKIRNMLIISDTKGDLKSASSECYDILSLTDREVVTIEVDSISDISKEKLKEIIREYDSVHFAGHGKYSSESGLDNGWFLTGGSFTTKDIQEIAGGTSMPKFVFSNACQSARMTEWRFHTEKKQISGLASEFVFAGTKHAIGTFWDIIDSSGSEFAVSFYKDLFSGKSVGESIQRNFYPGYLLIGDPSIKYFKSENDDSEEEETYNTNDDSEEETDNTNNTNNPGNVTNPTSPLPTRGNPLKKFLEKAKDNIKKEPILLFFTIWIIIIIGYVLVNNIIRLGNDVIIIINNKDKRMHIEKFEISVKNELKEINKLIEKYKQNGGKCKIQEFSIAVENELNHQFQELRDIVMAAIQKKILESTCFSLLENNPEPLKKIINYHIHNKIKFFQEPEKILFYIVQKQYIGSGYYLLMRLVDMQSNSVEGVFVEDFIYNSEKPVRPQVERICFDFVKKLNEYPFKAKIINVSDITIIINKGHYHGIKLDQIFSNESSTLTMTVQSIRQYSSTLNVAPTEKEYQLQKGMEIYKRCNKDE